MKKIVSILLAIAMVLSMFTFAAAEEEEIVLRIANNVPYDAGNRSGGFDEALEIGGFFEKHPNVKIEHVFIAEQSDYNQKLATIALGGGEELDGVWVDAAAVGILANNGVLMNLDEYYANASFDVNDDSVWLSKAANTFPWYQGSRYSFPFQTDCRVAFWYKPICEACGYTKENYPKTVEEFIEFCQKVSEMGYDPWCIRSAESWTVSYELSLPYFGSGGTFERFDEEKQQWVANLDNEIARKWLTDMRALYKTIPGDYTTTVDGAMAGSLASNGVAACHFTGTWFWSSWTKNNTEVWKDYECTLIPAGSQYSASSMGGWQLGIFKGATKEKADLLWEAFECIANNPEANAKAAKAAMPFRRDAYQYATWAENEYTAQGWEMMGKQLETAQPICTPPCECAGNIYAAMSTIWQELVMTDEYTVDEAAVMLNDVVQTAIDDYYGY